VHEATVDPLGSVVQFQSPIVVPPPLRAESSTEWASAQSEGLPSAADEVTA